MREILPHVYAYQIFYMYMFIKTSCNFIWQLYLNKPEETKLNKEYLVLISKVIFIFQETLIVKYYD